jgi:hypothetical protein
MEFAEDCRQAVLDSTVSVKTDPRTGFGPQLDPVLAPASVTVHVTCSEGVEHDGQSLIFDADSRVGLHLHQWSQRFGEDKVAIAVADPENQRAESQARLVESDSAAMTVLPPTVVTLELADHAAEITADVAARQAKFDRRAAYRAANGLSLETKPRPADAVVDLDPTIETTAANLKRWCLDGRPTNKTWAQVRNAAECTVATQSWLPGYGCNPNTLRVVSGTQGHVIARLTATFDTSKVEGTVTSCKFRVKGYGCLFYVKAGVALGAGNATYGNILSSGENVGQAEINESSMWWTSPEMVGHGFAKDEVFTVGLMTIPDYENDPDSAPSSDSNGYSSLFTTGDDAPYLEYEVSAAVAAGNRRSLCGVGR